MKENSSINSPWFTPREAADYCKVSLSFFNQKRKELPIKAGGSMRRPRFHKDELDFWMANNFQVRSGTHEHKENPKNNIHQKEKRNSINFLV